MLEKFTSSIGLSFSKCLQASSRNGETDEVEGS